MGSIDQTWHIPKEQVMTVRIPACMRVCVCMCVWSKIRQKERDKDFYCVRDSLKPHMSAFLWYDESLLWSSFLERISLWSVITIPSRLSCRLQHKCFSLTNSVWFRWKMKVFTNIAFLHLKCTHKYKHRRVFTSTLFATEHCTDTVTQNTFRSLNTECRNTSTFNNNNRIKM